MSPENFKNHSSQPESGWDGLLLEIRFEHAQTTRGSKTELHRGHEGDMKRGQVSKEGAASDTGSPVKF